MPLPIQGPEGVYYKGETAPWNMEHGTTMDGASGTTTGQRGTKLPRVPIYLLVGGASFFFSFKRGGSVT